MKGTTAGNEVVFIGESFIAASAIPEETTTLAIQNGSLSQGDKYLDFSVSGTRLGDGAIPRQYTQAQAQNPIRFVLMNGGGNDCLQAGDPNSPIPAAEGLFAEMAADGVEKVVYFFYPDAVGSFGGPGSQLQTCLEEYRPKIKAVCDSLQAPKCHWLDLAETSWDGNEAAYTTDGIHPNAQGAKVTADAIWETMVENCVAQ
jgi:lysophospholipase L1-like esterase